jgi:hypothetical protein
VDPQKPTGNQNAKLVGLQVPGIGRSVEDWKYDTLSAKCV